MDVYSKLEEGLKQGKCYLIEVKYKWMELQEQRKIRILIPNKCYWDYIREDEPDKIENSELSCFCSFYNTPSSIINDMKQYDITSRNIITKYVELTNGFDYYVNPEFINN